jgi:hypothetical protein
VSRNAAPQLWRAVLARPALPIWITDLCYGSLCLANSRLWTTAGVAAARASRSKLSASVRTACFAPGSVNCAATSRACSARSSHSTASFKSDGIRSSRSVLQREVSCRRWRQEALSRQLFVQVRGSGDPNGGLGTRRYCGGLRAPRRREVTDSDRARSVAGDLATIRARMRELRPEKPAHPPNAICGTDPTKRWSPRRGPNLAFGACTGAGLPKAVASAGTSRVTTLPAPISASSVRFGPARARRWTAVAPPPGSRPAGSASNGQGWRDRGQADG